jgi:hypothetical protein
VPTRFLDHLVSFLLYRCLCEQARAQLNWKVKLFSFTATFEFMQLICGRYCCVFAFTQFFFFRQFALICSFAFDKVTYLPIEVFRFNFEGSGLFKKMNFQFSISIKSFYSTRCICHYFVFLLGFSNDFCSVFCKTCRNTTDAINPFEGAFRCDHIFSQ